MPDFTEFQFKPVSFDETEINVWQERDRLHIELRRKDDGTTLVEWWDEDAYAACEDGFLRGLGPSPRQGGKLHRTAYAYWHDHICITKEKTK